MKKSKLKQPPRRKSGPSRLQWMPVTIGVILCLSGLLVYGRNRLVEELQGIQKEYRIDLALSQETGTRKQAYQEVIDLTQVPNNETLNMNTWIQETQALVSSEHLMLGEIKPVNAENKRQSQQQLYLSLEGTLQNIFGFMYQLATAANVVYIQQFSMSSSSDHSDVVRVQMTLGQIS